MKTCQYCGATAENDVKFCAACGAQEFIETQEQPAVPQASQPAPVNINDNGNILAGVVGAFLFAMIGGLLYFVIYQAGFIAGICGLVMFVLANFGYGLLARTQNKLSLVGLISAIVATVVMIFVAEYVSIAFDLYEYYKDYGMSFFDALQALPEAFSDSEFIGELVKELGMAYLFAAIASIGNIVNIVKARKNAKQ